MKEGPECCHKEKRWYENKLFWVVCVTGVVVAAGLWVPFLKPLTLSYGGYLKIVWWPILLGIFLGGLIDRFVPTTYITKILSQGRQRTIFLSALLGFLASACSHGILALAMELHKKGASGPAVVSFLLASPWANLPVTLLLVGFFGTKGLIIITGALLVAVTTGLMFLYLERKGWIERRLQAPGNDFSIREDIRKRWRSYRWSFAQLQGDFRGVLSGMGGLSQMVLWWVLIGLFLASLADTFVPSSFFQRFMGPTSLGLLVTLAAATLLEVCSEGTAPLAFEIYKQTGALGNTFVFLTAGFITDYTEIGLVWINLGRRTALWLILLTVPQVLLLGFLLNLFGSGS